MSDANQQKKSSQFDSEISNESVRIEGGKKSQGIPAMSKQKSLQKGTKSQVKSRLPKGVSDQNDSNDDNNQLSNAQEKFQTTDGGLGYSDFAYYNVLMKGGRVTRGTIRKEEEPQQTIFGGKNSLPKQPRLNKAESQDVSKRIKQQDQDDIKSESIANRASYNQRLKKLLPTKKQAIEKQSNQQPSDTQNSDSSIIIEGNENKQLLDKVNSKKKVQQNDDTKKQKILSKQGEQQKKNNKKEEQINDDLSIEVLEPEKKIRKLIEKQEPDLKKRGSEIQKKQQESGVMKKRNEKAVQKVQGDESKVVAEKQTVKQNKNQNEVQIIDSQAIQQSKLYTQQKFKSETLQQKSETNTKNGQLFKNQNQDQIENQNQIQKNNSKQSTQQKKQDKDLEQEQLKQEFLQPFDIQNKFQQNKQNKTNEYSDQNQDQLKINQKEKKIEENKNKKEFSRQKKREEQILFGENQKDEQMNKTEKIKKENSEIECQNSEIQGMLDQSIYEEGYSILPQLQQDQINSININKNMNETKKSNFIDKISSQQNDKINDQEEQARKFMKKDQNTLSQYEQILQQRQQDLKEKYEFHFPHFQYIQNRLVLYGEGAATIESIEIKKQQKNQAINPNDYEKIEAQIKVYQDSPSITMPVKILKYLSRVYLCDIKHINVDNLSDEIKENIKQGQQGKILLVQIVDNSYRYQDEVYKNKFKNDSQDDIIVEIKDKKINACNFLFYAIGKEDFEDKLILSGPVQFINEIEQNDYVKLIKFRNKSDQQVRNSQRDSSDQRLLKKLEQKFDILKDLQLFEENQNQNEIKSNQISEFLMKQSIEINKIFNQYKEKISKVLINEHNMFNSLFTVCQFDNHEKQRCKGVLTQIRYLQNECYLQFRHIQMKSSQNEKLEWVPLLVSQISDYLRTQNIDSLQSGELLRKKSLPENQTKYYHVVAEYFRGFVSLECLKYLDNTFQYGTRLRTKHLVFVSHEINCIQIQKQLNLTLNNKDNYDNSQNRNNQSPAINSINQSSLVVLDGESIQSSLQYKNKSMISALKNDQLIKASKNGFQNGSTQAKCICCYKQNDENVLQCSECNNKWHYKCLKNKEQQSLIGMGEKLWRCPTCIRCTNCKSMILNQKLMLICKTCNTPYHYDCLDPVIKNLQPCYIVENYQKLLNDQNLYNNDQQLNNIEIKDEILKKNQDKEKNIILQKYNEQSQQKQLKFLQTYDFQCHQCIECIDCNSKDIGNINQSKWSQDYNFCSKCFINRKKNQYCQVCLTNYQIPKKDAFDQQIIKCLLCSKYVHFECDFVLQNLKIRKMFMDNQNQQNKNTLNYCCQECRDKKRIQMQIFILNQIKMEDKNKFFIDKFWELNDNEAEKQNYLKVIKKPICFNTIMEQVNQQIYFKKSKDNNFKNDLFLIFQNSKNFNKYNTLVYQDSIKLEKLSNEIFQKWQNLLQRQINAHNVEQKWKIMVHSQEDFQKKYFKIVYQQNKEKENFKKDLEDIVEWKNNDLEYLKSDEGIKEIFIEQEYFLDEIWNAKIQDSKNLFAQSKIFEKTQSQLIYDSAPLKQINSQKLTQNKNIENQNDLKSQNEKLEQTSQISLDKKNKKVLRRGDQMNEKNENNSAVVQKSQVQENRAKFFEKSAPSEFQLQGLIDDGTQNYQSEKYDQNEQYNDISKQKKQITQQMNLNASQKNNLKRSKKFQDEDIVQLDEQMDNEDQLSLNLNNKQKNKRQKVKDIQDTIADQIGQILNSESAFPEKKVLKTEEIKEKKQRQKNEGDKFSFKDNYSINEPYSHRKIQNNDKTDLNSASGTNTSILNIGNNQNQNKNKEKSKKKMIEHYQKVDDEGCYYPNPIRCSFDDPRLIFEEMCYLCGSFGNQVDFVTCILCGESFHTFCLQLQSEDVQGMYQSNWKCLNCKSCENCGKATNEDLLMFCGVCDRPYHSFCLQPEIKNIPEHWKCEYCFKCKQCGTNKYFNENDIKNGVHLSVNDYQLSKNFSLCYDCGQNEYKKQNCSICLEKTTTDMNNNLEILKCRDCGYYSHIQCSRVTIEELQALLQEYKEKIEKQQKGKQIQNKQRFSIQKIYKCLDCIIKGKSVNFLILESCLHYENIHNLIQRQQFISEICVEILSQYFPDKFRSKAPRFIQKFITNNKDFFRSDEILVKWLELMETEVSYSKDLYQNTPLLQTENNQVKQIEQDNKCDVDMDQKETKKLNVNKSYWRKYNPFEPSKYYSEQDESKRRSMYDYERIIYNIDEKTEDKNIPNAVKVEHSMSCFKQSILPLKRSMYESLYKGNLNRYHQSGKISQKNFQKDSINQSEEQAQDQNIEMQINDQKMTQGTQGESIYLKPQEIQSALYDTDQKREKLVNIMLNGLDPDDELSSEYLDSDSSEQNEDPEIQNNNSLSLVEMYMHYEIKAIMRIKLQFFKWFEEFFQKTINVFLGNSQHQTNQKQKLQLEYSKDEDGDVSNNFKNIEYNSDQESVDSMVETLDDHQIINPQINLTCLLCKKKGEFSVTGRLIPYRLNIFVHTNCALWTDGVFEIEDGQIVNFYHQQKKLINNKCYFCNEYGASLTCSKHLKGCNKFFHFPCVYKSGKVKFTKNKEIFCENCQKNGGKQNSIIQTEMNQQDMIMNGNEDQNQKPVMFPAEYIKNRRLYIVQNLEEINQIEYENDLENQNQNDDKRMSNSQSVQSGTRYGYNDKYERTNKSERQRKEKTGDSISYNSYSKGNGKDIEVDKWRPYYYDFFNRVGNLTVLSLRKEVNQLIDVLQFDNQSQGQFRRSQWIKEYFTFRKNFLDQIVNFQQQNNVQKINKFAQDLDSPRKEAKQQNMNNFQNITSQQNNNQQNTLLDELYKYLDLFDDYATIRIYWKFYDDKKMKIPSKNNNDPRKLQRGYFLYLNKSKKIYEIEKNDIQTIMEFCSKQIKNNILIQNNLSVLRRESGTLNIEYNQGQGFPSIKQQQKNKDDENLIDQQKFWKSTLDHFYSQRKNFCLQNIEFCVEKLFGLAKYPINVWNQQQFSNNDLKHNLNSCRGRISFFLKSGIDNLNQISANQVGFSYPYSLSGNINGNVTNQPNKDKRNNQADMQQILTGRVLSLDGVFQRMMKVNNMERYDYDKIIINYSQNKTNNQNSSWLRSSIIKNNNHSNQIYNRMEQISINQLSSKHMSYDQLMIALGKGRKVAISKISKILEDQKISHNKKSKSGVYEDNDSFESSQQRTRKKVLESKQQLQQINFQNQAQQELAEQSANQIGSQNAIKMNKTNLPIAMQYRSAIQMPRKVELGPSKIHRIGLFTNEDLKPLDIVIEYVGEIITNEIADKREKNYLGKGIGDCYMFRVDDNNIIDATFFGGKARYLNHSCDANCSAKIITVDNQKHIIIRAKKHICSGQELTYNYNFDQEEDKLGCFCGAKNCQGYLA